MEFRDKLLRLMSEMDISQTDIAKHTGASKASVSLWVKGDTRPGNKFLPSLSELLVCDSGWLMKDSAPWEHRNTEQSEDLWEQIKNQLDKRSVKDAAKISGLIDKYVDQRLDDLEKGN